MPLSLPPASHSETGSPVPGGKGFFAAAWAGARRQWLLAGLVGTLLGGAAAAGYYTLTPQKYTLTTTLQITSLDPLIHEHEVQTQAVEYRRTQAALIHTRPVIRKALENRKVADSALLKGKEDPAGWLEIELKAAALEGGQIRVALSGENPEELAATLNAVTDAYLTMIIGGEETQRRTRLDELDKVLAASQDRIREQRNQLRGLAENLRTSDTQALTLKQQMVLQQYAGLQKELLTIESQIRASRSLLEVKKAKLEAAKLQPIPDTVLTDFLAADPAVKAAATEVTRLRDGLDRSAGTVQPGSPAYNKMAADVKAAEERLATIKSQQQEVVQKPLREVMTRDATIGLAEAESNARVLDLQRASLKKEVDDAKLEAEKIGLGSFDLEVKRAEIAEAEAIVRKLRAEKERLTIEMQTYKPRVTMSSPAEAALAKPATSAVMTAAGAGLVGVALGVLGVGGLESRRRRLVHSQDVAHVMKFRVLGNLPQVAGLPGGPLTDVWGPRLGIVGSLLAEAVSDFRTMLLAGDARRTPQVVMVTSAGQGEGKTTLACLLALSLAQTGKRTLLIDGDLRNPRVADRLGLAPAAGFGEVLRGTARPAAVIGGVPGTSLAVMTAGRPCTNTIRGLSVERVMHVVAELREQFDHIVFDTCPTPLPDGLVIGACTDAAVLVARSGLSHEPAVREACERLLASRVPLIGGVVNGLPLDRRWLRYPYTALAQSNPTNDAPAPVAELA